MWKTPRDIETITARITCCILGKKFKILVKRDQDNILNGRIYLQAEYRAPCTKTGKTEKWRGRKWYLSDYMTEDEIVKTAYCAFEASVKHEIMEGFKFDGIVVFNPHLNFRELIKISHKEIRRK